MIAVALLAIGAALALYVFVTVDWHRVVTILRTGPAWQEPMGKEPERWRRVHIDADRRAPFARVDRRR